MTYNVLSGTLSLYTTLLIIASHQGCATRFLVNVGLENSNLW